MHGVGTRRAGRLDDRHLHAEADAEIGNLAFTRESRRGNLALGATLAETAGDENAMDIFEIGCRILALEDLGFDPFEIDLHTVGHAAVIERHDQPHDLVGAFEDLVHAQVPDNLLDAVIREIAVAAVQLQALIGHLRARLGDEFLGHGAELGGIRRALVELPRRLAQEGAGGLKLDLHVGKAELQRLELVDALAEGAALGHVAQRGVERRLRRPERAGRDVEPAAVEPGHGVAEALALLAQQVGGGDDTAIHLHLPGGLRLPAHLLLEPAEGEPLGAVLDHEGRDAARAVGAAAGHDDIGVGIAAARDEGLGAGKRPAVARGFGPGPERRRVRSRAGLGQAVGQHRLHGAGAGEEPLLQLGRAVGVDHPRAHVVDRQERRDRGAGHAQRLEDQRRVEARKPRAAVLFADVDAPEPEQPDLVPELARDGAFSLPRRRMRRDLLLPEGVGHVEDGGLFFAQRKIHVGPPLPRWN